MESNSVNSFEDDHPRNIRVKFDPNWPSGLGGEIVLKIFSIMYSASNPLSQEPCLLTNKNFANIFLKKGYPMNIHVKLFQNLTSSFLEQDF